MRPILPSGCRYVADFTDRGPNPMTQLVHVVLSEQPPWRPGTPRPRPAPRDTRTLCCIRIHLGHNAEDRIEWGTLIEPELPGHVSLQNVCPVCLAVVRRKEPA